MTKTEKLSKTEVRILQNLHLRNVIGNCGNLPLAKRLAILSGLVDKGLITNSCNVTPKGIEASLPSKQY